MEEKQGLFPSLTGQSLRPEGNFKSSGSSRDSIAAAGECSAYLRRDINSDQLKEISAYLTTYLSEKKRRKNKCSYSNCQKGET